jgi:hypothetical protein
LFSRVAYGGGGYLFYFFFCFIPKFIEAACLIKIENTSKRHPFLGYSQKDVFLLLLNVLFLKIRQEKRSYTSKLKLYSVYLDLKISMLHPNDEAIGDTNTRENP